MESHKFWKCLKTHCQTKLYWVLFPIENLRQAVETAKTILTKEKLDRQLTGQSSTSPFMNIRDGNDRRVSFNARDELGDKIDKSTAMMSKLVAKESHERKPFLCPRFTKVEDKVGLMIAGRIRPDKVRETEGMI